MAPKGRLHKLKSWLTISDTASYLSAVFEENVTSADVLQLSLEGHLTLSVHLVNHAKIKRGTVTHLNDTEMFIRKAGVKYAVNNHATEDGVEEEARRLSGTFTISEIDKLSDQLSSALRKGEYFLCPRGDQVSEDKYIRFDCEVTTASGIWDLPMVGAEELDVQHYLQLLTDGPEVTLLCLGGALLADEHGNLYQLQDSFNRDTVKATKQKALKAKGLDATNVILHDSDIYYPAGRLPEDGALVVRRKNLDAFIASLDEPEPALGVDAGGDELRALEALGLLIETMAKQSHKYRVGEAGRPNCAQIAEAMSQQADDIYGMKPRTLKGRLGEALTAWQEKCR